MICKNCGKQINKNGAEWWHELPRGNKYRCDLLRVDVGYPRTRAEPETKQATLKLVKRLLYES
jgi:hypothetical protein